MEKTKDQLKITSWNVNGIRAVLKKDFIESLKYLNSDIVCLQETKAHPDQVEHDLKNLGYNYEYWNSAEKKGYSGTAIFSKIEPINVTYDLGFEKHDKEGRVITAEYENFYLVTVYTPNSKRDLSRLEERTNEWDILFLNHCIELEKTKPVIFCGDLNAAHTEIDVKNDKSNKTTATKPGAAGFTDSERNGIKEIISKGFTDTFRKFHPEKEKFSWWSYMGRARANNVGWRIDYFFTSGSIENKLLDAEIEDQIIGSDHCPVTLTLKNN
jgi:exodeoxyribonuclease-3